MNTRQFLLQDGDVVTPDGVRQVDILIDGERIAAVGPHLAGDAPAAERIDITGLTVLPGLIDVHVHLREPGGEHKEDFFTGTCAALAGGVTTVCAMPNTAPPITDRATFEDVAARAAARAVCDYGLYVGATPGNAAEAAALSREAVALKMYIGSSTGDLLVDQFPAQIAHFEQYPKDCLIAVHAEDEAAVQYYAARGLHRPPICAALATARALVLAEHTDHRLHICHVSTGYELALIANAKRHGLDVTCEATPHHLFMTADEDGARLGPLAKVNPPLRDAANVMALWEQRDVIDLIASDHAPHTLEEKRSDSPPSGIPGLETMLPLLLAAVNEGRLSLSDVARWTSARPAQVFGFARKGCIAAGYDADLTLVDMRAERTLGGALYTRCGWTPFAGRQVRGLVVQVYLRGRQVFANGRVLAEPGSGRGIRR